jgi:Zn-dependent protease
MDKGMANGIRLFRLLGIDVYLHWMWVVVAVVEINWRSRSYTWPVWNAIEYLTLFGIVLMHEFGHALACRSVGGRADRILLWPLGGVAYVAPPPRPGAVLWSIAAGPLVNVVLVPITLGAAVLARTGTIPASTDVHHWMVATASINLGLLIFNLLPIYPLDGGQILRALLWFVIGPSRSLLVASSIGFVSGVGVALAAITRGRMWLTVIAVFVALTSWRGFQQSRALHKRLSLPRREGVRCPACGLAPAVGVFWKCTCGQGFDTFASEGVCPQCAKRYEVTTCADCRVTAPRGEWYPSPTPRTS